MECHDSRLVSYFGDQYGSRGTTVLTVKHGDEKIEERFYVVDEKVVPSLRGDAAERLGLIARISQVQEMDSELMQYMELYPAAFRGAGCLKNHKCTIKLKSGYKPCVNPCRRIPLALEGEVKAELSRMTDKGVIVPVVEPTEFVSNIVTARKSNGKMRICLDPTHLNKAIERGTHPTKRLEQVAAKLHGAILFSTLDADEGFWQVPLDEESSKLCTFITPWGRFRFTRMPYGLVNASDEFQRLTDNLFADIEGVCVVVDDILVWGNTREQHDSRVAAVFERCVAEGMVLNTKKCKIAKSSVKYLGMVLDRQGIRIDQTRINDIHAVRPPSTVKQLQSFLGMTNYVSAFIRGYTDITAPLRELLKRDTAFVWQERQQRAFDSLRSALTAAPVLSLFNPEKPIILSGDASQYGLGAVLLQEGDGGVQPVAYASRTLTETQKGYAQIEKELLAIVFGCSKFHYYIFGSRRVRVESDHKPLDMIMKKPLHQVSIRLQRMRLILQRYDIDVQYVPGKELHIADCLSRNPSGETMEEIAKIATVIEIPATDARLQQLREMGEQDEQARALKKFALRVGQMTSNRFPLSSENTGLIATRFMFRTVC